MCTSVVCTRALAHARSHPHATLPTGTFVEMARNALAICHDYGSAEDATDYNVMDQHFYGSGDVCAQMCARVQIIMNTT